MDFLNKCKLIWLICIRFLKRHKNVVSLTVLVLAAVVLLQVKFNFFFDTNILRIGIIGTYQEYDLPPAVTKLLSEPLVETSSDGNSKPNLVTGWEVNKDDTLFKFKLKNNLLWADGSKVKAGDLSFNIADVDISAPQDNIIQFKLKDSYAPFPSLLTKPVFKKGNMVGVGPYRIRKIEKSGIFITRLTLEPNDKNLPKIYIRFYPNEKWAEVGFNLGEISTILGVSKTDFVSTNPKAKVFATTDYNKIVTILYNTKDSLLSNRSLRQALSFQAPQIKGYEVADNPFPKNSWAYDPTSKKYLDNNAEAEAAMSRAKSSIDTGQLKQGLTITAVSNLEGVAEEVASAWEKLGINVKVRVESGIPQNFQILLLPQSIPSDPDQYFLWHSTQTGSNLSKYSSPRVDKDLEDGRKTVNQSDRKTKYFDFQHALLEDAPATFLYFPKYNIVYLKKIEGNLKKILPLEK